MTDKIHDSIDEQFVQTQNNTLLQNDSPQRTIEKGSIG